MSKMPIYELIFKKYIESYICSEQFPDTQKNQVMLMPLAPAMPPCCPARAKYQECDGGFHPGLGTLSQ
jgi:hypothetical protein